MNGAVILRVVPALAGALFISLAVFLFIQNLIRVGNNDRLPIVVYEDIRILHEPPEKERPEDEAQKPDATLAEPQAEPLALHAAKALAPIAELELPALDFALPPMAMDMPPGNAWSAPLGEGGIALEKQGQDARGFVEVVPYNTRRPNVPEVAWSNRINGWVLVAFSVTAQGKTRDIRVLDANPRGVFEAKVIAAVADWRYKVSFNRDFSGDVVLTQRVEVQWRNYPQNLPNVD